MDTNWAEQISGENVVDNSSEGIFFNIEVAPRGSSRANCRYILREVALDPESKYESIYLHNLWTKLLEVKSSYERFVRIVSELVGQVEDREMLYHSERTFYRLVISFGKKVETTIAKRLVAEYFQKYFPLNYALAVVHQNSPHTHVHVNLPARNINGKKLHFNNQTYKSLDILWGEVFAKHFGAHHLETHLEKKAETREYKRALARGEERERPERYHYSRQDFEQQERRSIGYEKIRDIRNQPELAIESDRTRERSSDLAPKREGFDTRSPTENQQYSKPTIDSERVDERPREIDSAMARAEPIAQSRTTSRENFSSATLGGQPVVSGFSREIESREQKLGRTLEFDGGTISRVGELRERIDRALQRTNSGVGHTVERVEQTGQYAREATSKIERTDSGVGRTSERVEQTGQYTREATSKIERTDSGVGRTSERVEQTGQYTREATSKIERTDSGVGHTVDNSKQIEWDIAASTSRAREINGAVREEYSRVERTGQCCRQIERSINGFTERTRELVITRQRQNPLSREIEREIDYPSR